MNAYDTGEKSSPIDQNIILNTLSQLRKKSFIPQTDMGDAIYEWMDSQVENLSSARLAEILRQTEGFVDSYFVKAAKQVLKSRGHYEQSLNWKCIGL